MNRGPASAWLAGLVLGVTSAFGMLELGFYGIGFALVSLLLIAWKGPRLLATAGFATGLGLTWTVLFLRVQLSCRPMTDVASGEGCYTDDLTGWILGGGFIFVSGLVASALALQRMRRRG